MDIRSACYLLVGLCVVFSASVCSVQAQTSLPPLEISVTEVEQQAQYRSDTGTTWEPLQVGVSLRPGDRIRTDESGIVTLEIPGVSYIKVTPNTEMEVQNLERYVEERGLLTSEQVTVNEIELESIEGKVQNSVREREGVATQYELKTPNAIAGIRGTAFQCDVDVFGRTECGVGSGEVEFRSRANPDRMVNLRAGQMSAMEPDATEPDRPAQLSAEASSEIEQIEEASRSALLLPPAVSDVELNGTSFKESIRLAYREETELTLTGRAVPREDDAEVVSVTATINGELVEVTGLENWTITGTPAVPEEGTEVTVTIGITVTDSNDKASTSRLTATLVNPEKRGDATSIPPENYDDGHVPVEVLRVAGRSANDLEFPYHAYRGDRSGEGLLIEGTASAEATVEGVAYSLDGGQYWTLAEGGENWSFTIPASQSGDFTPRVVAWTVDGVIGEPVETGEILYEAQTFQTVVREQFEEQWQAFERENTSRFISFFSSEFIFTDPAQESSLDRSLTLSEFESFIQDAFRDMRNLRVFYRIDQIFGSSNGAKLTLETMEWEGRETHTERNSGRSAVYPFVSRGEGAFSYQREGNGQFKMISMDEVSLRFFFGYEKDFDGNPLVLGHRFGMYFASRPVDNIGNGLIGQDCHEGDVVIGFDTGVEWTSNPNPANFMVNDGTTGYTPCAGDIESGGIYNTGQRSFSEINRIPSISSSKYISEVEIEEGYVYALNIRQRNGNHKTALIEVLSLRDTNADNKVDEVRIRVVDAGGAPILEFRGANPFQ